MTCSSIMFKVVVGSSSRLQSIREAMMLGSLLHGVKMGGSLLWLAKVSNFRTGSPVPAGLMLTMARHYIRWTSYSMGSSVCFTVIGQDPYAKRCCWPLRSSTKPLAKLYTNPISRSQTRHREETYYMGHDGDSEDEESDGTGSIAASPVGSSFNVAPTGSRVRRSPARVVKFSPVGSSRDLLVFSEVSIDSSFLSTTLR